MEPILAMIVIFGGNFAPSGWAMCMGNIFAIASNTALFSLLGTTYGGDGQTTFALPDLRGRAPIGMGQGPGLNNMTWGQMGGIESTTLTQSNMPSHIHTINVSGLQAIQPASTTAGTSNVPGPTVVPAALPTLGTGPSASTIKGYAATSNTNMQPLAITGTAQANPAGGSTAFSVRDPYLAVNYIIALEGIYPSRG